MRRMPLRGLLGELGYRMSQSKLIKASIVIPASLYFGLSSHMMYRHYVETPDPIEIQVILSVIIYDMKLNLCSLTEDIKEPENLTTGVS